MKSILLLAFFLISSQNVFAHGSHPRRIVPCKTVECTQAEIEAVAPEVLAQLILNGRIDQSWSDVKVSKVEKKGFKKGADWTLTYINPKSSDRKKQRFFAFITLDGYFNGSNFTGE
jgi:hypothetical protein